VTVPVVEARPAATAMALRETDQGIEVLMVHRPEGGFFGGLTVFPGGALDPEDESTLAGLVAPGEVADRSYRIAALRELAEETGIALTTEGPVRAPLAKGVALLEALLEQGIQLDLEALTLVSRWVTPEYAPKRYDTRFYLARAQDAPAVRLDAEELVAHVWVRPGEALHRHAAGEWDMFLPTVSHLRWLDLRVDVEDAIASAQGADGRSLVQPRHMEDGSIVPVHLPGDP
jgi:8-oxo-dGTP pyrophosphatase MutT (NUDIX family)